MIGRGAHGSPWIFRDVNAFLDNGKKSAAALAQRDQRHHPSHITALYAFHGEAAGVRIARKHLGWYCQPHSGTKGFRPQLMAAESSSSQFAVAAACFGRWAWKKTTTRTTGLDGSNGMRTSRTNRKVARPKLAYSPTVRSTRISLSTPNCRCATTPNARSPTTSPTSTATARPGSTTWCCAKSKSRCSAPCSTTPAATRARPRSSSASRAARCARSCASSASRRKLDAPSGRKNKASEDPMDLPIRRALLSVSDKSGLLELARAARRARRGAAVHRRHRARADRRRHRGARGGRFHRLSRRSWTAASRRCTRRSTAACWAGAAPTTP